MEKEIISRLTNKGIKVNQEEAMQIVEQWQAIQNLRKSMHNAKLEANNIGLVNQPGGYKE